MSKQFKLPDIFNGPYIPEEHEEAVYKRWESSDYANPDVCIADGVAGRDAETFSMILPPPNVTGQLHLGHALEHSIQDTIVRFNRMRGKRTVWIPGTDHAAIATQAKVENRLYEQTGKTRHDIGRETFLDRVKKFAQESHDTIVRQIKRMGASVDWSREAYTLDKSRRDAVYTAFKRMYDAGLIYRDNRVVNWDPKGQTTVSDDEVEHEETTGTLYTFRYDTDFPIPIATTRPETKLGDTAVAVHPDDDRYAEYVGEEFNVVFAGTELHIIVIADREIDPEFGTGAVGITPAHSMTDWRLARRHNLPLKQVINEKAEVTDTGTDLDGLPTAAARKRIVASLKKDGLLEKTEEITMNISKAERSGGTIEPLPKLQWFVAVDKPFVPEEMRINGIASGTETTLKEIMRKAVSGGQVEILPDRFEKTYHHWIDKLHDWCISRQIWFGHRIPVYYCRNTQETGTSQTPHSECKEPIVSDTPITKCPHCGGDVEQDPDTLDTWFSSGLWSFSTLGWPDNTDDLRTYHPTTLLNAGHDILFFWVARMIMMSGFLLGDIPFETVYIHGMVRDERGRKFSKSLDNGIEPEEVIDEFGTDALRMSMLVGVGPGNDVNFDLEQVKAYKRFANKIWNGTKFVLMNVDDYNGSGPKTLGENDKKRLSELKETVAEITDDIENYRLYLAAEKLYHYFWHTFADEVIEENKERLYGDDPTEKERGLYVLTTILATTLKMLHPFMPFVTERIWQHMPTFVKKRDLLMVERWPMEQNDS